MKGFKKTGLMFLALVIALAGIGGAYAAWTDTITIEGTVNTGSVDLEIVELSGTKVWKTLDDHGLVQRDWVMDFKLHPAVPPPANSILVAESGARVGGAEEADIVMWWDNIFPSIYFKADALLHYNGSIPVRVMLDYGADAGSEWILPYVTATMRIVERGGQVVDIPVYEGTQLHFSDLIYLEVIVHLDQLPELMDRTASGWCDITVIQWNEYAD